MIAGSVVDQDNGRDLEISYLPEEKPGWKRRSRGI
jgi:hypothetical protein